MNFLRALQKGAKNITSSYNWCKANYNAINRLRAKNAPIPDEAWFTKRKNALASMKANIRRGRPEGAPRVSTRVPGGKSGKPRPRLTEAVKQNAQLLSYWLLNYVLTLKKRGWLGKTEESEQTKPSQEHMAKMKAGRIAYLKLSPEAEKEIYC
jgi:hypothetical protein